MVRGNRFELWQGVIRGKPVHCLLKIAKGSHVPPFDAADERKKTRAAMAFSRVENRQAKIPVKTDVTKRIDQGGQFIGGKFRVRIARVQHGPIDSAHFAGFSQLVKRGTTRHQVECAFSAEADEFRRPYDFKLD